MAGVVPNEAELNIAELLTTVTCTLRLFSNDITPDADTELTDLTEMSFSGYAGVEISWTGPATVSNIARLISQSCRFEADSGISAGPYSAYGWYITYEDGAMADRLVALERFPSPVAFEFEHDVKDVTATLDFKQAGT